MVHDVQFRKNVVLIALLVFSIAVYFLNFDLRSQYVLSHVMNGDLYFLQGFAEDILFQAHSIRTWYLPASNSFFPDLTIISILLLFVRQVSIVWLAYTFLFISGLSANVYFLLKYLKCSRAAMLSGLSFFLFSLAAVNCGEWISFTVFIPGWHGAENLMGLLLFVLLANSLTGHFSVLSKAFAFALTTLAVFSEKLFIPHFIIPLLFPILVMWRFGLFSWRELLEKTSVILLPIIPAAILTHFSKSLSFGFEEPEVHFGLTPSQFLNFFRIMFSSQFFALSLLTIAALLACIFVLMKNFRKPKATQNKPLVFLCLFALTCLFVTFLLPFFTQKWESVARLRYMTPIFIVPAFLLSIVGWSAKYNHSLRILRTSLFSVMVICSFWQIVKQQSDSGAESIMEGVHCVDNLANKYGVKTVFAQYHISGFIRQFNSQDLNVVPTSEDEFVSIKVPLNRLWYVEAQQSVKQNNFMFINKSLNFDPKLVRKNPIVENCPGFSDVTIYVSRNAESK
jgi:hypothetical protein